VTISDNDVILCLMDKNKFTLVKDDVLETYKNNTVELEQVKQQLAELQAKLNSQEQSQEVIDGEFTEVE
jgi:hypothetical protein